MVKSTAPTRVTPSGPSGPRFGSIRETRAAVVIGGPDLSRAIYRNARRTTLHRDRADVRAIVLQMADRAAVQRVRHPHVIVLVDDAALRKRVALVEDAEQRAVRRKLPNLPVAKRRVPDVAAAVDTEAITRMVEAGPVAAIRACQRFRSVPTQHRVRRPDHTCLVDQTAVATETNRRLGSLDLAGDAVEQIEAATTRAAHPDVVVFVNRYVARAERVDLRVVNDALVFRSRDAAVRVRATGVGPGLDIVEAG